MSKIGDFLKKVLSDIGHFIQNLLPSSKHILDVVLAVVNAIKNFDTSNPQVLDTIVSLIPGTVDDVILAKIRQYLPEVVTKATGLENTINLTGDEILALGIKKIQELYKVDPNAAADQLQSIFKLLGFAVTDESITYQWLQKISQSFYEEFNQDVTGAVALGGGKKDCPKGQVWDGTKCVDDVG